MSVFVRGGSFSGRARVFSGPGIHLGGRYEAPPLMFALALSRVPVGEDVAGEVLLGTLSPAVGGSRHAAVGVTLQAVGEDADGEVLLGVLS